MGVFGLLGLGPGPPDPAGARAVEVAAIVPCLVDVGKVFDGRDFAGVPVSGGDKERGSDVMLPFEVHSDLDLSSLRLNVVPIGHGKTDVGRKRRHNEDYFLVRPDLGLFVVCDGMGGNNAGEVASALATTSLEDFFDATQSGVLPEAAAEDAALSETARRLALGVRKANADVYEISCTRKEHKGMGSTIVALLVSPETGSVEIAHVGDSRCYRVFDGAIEQMTRDHSLIGDALAWNPNLTEEELVKLPRNIISRALGLRATVDVDVRSEPAQAGAVYLLCSDGLSGMMKDQQILDLVLLADNLAEACDNLVAFANEAGGTDNITVVAVRLEGETPGPATPPPEITAEPLELGEFLSYLNEPGAPEVPTAHCAVCGEAPVAGDVFCGFCGARVLP